MIRLICPKCKQQDKGFSRQEILATEVDNSDRPKSVEGFGTNPEVIEGTARYYCSVEECNFDGTYEEIAVEVH